MVNLFDIASQAQRGAGFLDLSRQFGLEPAQAHSVVDALLPAFALAFQRQATNPALFAELLGAIGSGRYAPFFDQGGMGMPKAGSGDPLVTQLFQSPEATQAIAKQAAAMTGVGVQILQQMIPHLAAMLVGGMSRYASLEGMSDVLRQWSDALKTAARTANAAPSVSSQTRKDPWTAWNEVVQTMMGGTTRAAVRHEPTPSVFEAWSAAMAAMMGAKPTPAAPPPPKEPSPFDTLSRMFEMGSDVQRQHLAAFETILDRVWGSSAAR